MTLSVGDRLGRYEILGPLGAGGMGEVWKARDTELNRTVAVKVLPESVAQHPQRIDRFQREGRALAALSHPNLLDIYDVGSTNGLHYAVTELLEGDTLRQRIPTSGLPWQKAASIGAAVADGLAAAHGKGIVHRDLKPENFFVTADGRVKILDFGLAKVEEEIDPEGETGTLTPAGTEAGTIMGTPGYMAPEQVKGKPADSRSDIFALGCVLYEMVAGRRAFGGDTRMEVMAAILKEEPAQLSSSGAAVPVDLERTVHRCLEKRPEARFQSAADLAYSLKSIGSSQAPPVLATPTPTAVTPGDEKKRPSWQLAVAAALVLIAALIAWWALTRTREALPISKTMSLIDNRVAVMSFEAVDQEPSLRSIARLADDEVVHQLGEYRQFLRVIYTSVVAQPEITDIDIVLGSDASAATAITGSIYRQGSGGVVRGSVVDQRSNEIVFARTARWNDGESPSIVVSEIAEQLAISVVSHLHWMHLDWAARHPPRPEAFRAFLTGVNQAYRGNLEAETLLTKAVQLEPDWARPKLFFSWGLARLGRRDEARQLAESVLAMEGLVLFDELLARFQVAGSEGRFADQLDFAYRAHELAPRHTHLTRWVGQAAIKCNRPEFALEILNSIPVERLDPRGLTEKTTALHLLGRFDDELAAWREYSRLHPNPGDVFTQQGLLMPLAAADRLAEIEDLFTDWESLPKAAETLPNLFLIATKELNAHGHDAAAETLAARALRWIEASGAVDPCDACVAQHRIEFLDILGRPDEIAEIAHDALAEAPERWQTWELTGCYAARSGNTAKARAMSDLLADVDEPYAFGGPTYARACIAARLGEKDLAIQLLRNALSEGFAYGVDFHRDQDLEPLWDDPEFREIVNPKG